MLWVVVTLAALTAFLLLAALGAMRETVLLRGQVTALQELVRKPPPPSFVGARAPEPLIQVIEEAAHPAPPDRLLLIAFVSPGCGPCEDLVEWLSGALDAGEVAAESVLVAIWAATSEQAERFARRVSGPFVLDGKGALARSCEVRATPTLLLVSRADYRVIDFNLEGDTQWMISQLNSTQPAVAAL